MIEFKLACRYLSLRKKGLSRSLISVFSVCMITLIVWLLLVFLSVLEGVEKRWLSKVLSLTSPLRITPQEKYFKSFDYNVDFYSSKTNYNPRNIGQIFEEGSVYDSQEDETLPGYMSPERDAKGVVIHPVERLKEALADLGQGIQVEEYELSGALLQLTLLRKDDPNLHPTTTNFSQVTYLLTTPKHVDTLVQKELSKELRPPDRYGLILPKSYEENGIRVGDEGNLAYQCQLATKTTEQKIPVFVQGFYDPGMMTLGGKCLLTPQEIVRTINQASGLSFLDSKLSNGLFIRFSDLKKTQEIEKKIKESLKSLEIDSYWKLTPYTEYEFSKELLQQFHSDKALFLLIGILILVIASSNIISSLTLLVQDRRKEIGVLQALGLSRINVVMIFALAGIIIGLISSLLGMTLAFFTIHYIDPITSILQSYLGISLVNSPLFAEGLPKTISQTALNFVMIATPCLSLIAGMIAAYKAAKIKPAQILKESSQ